MKERLRENSGITLIALVVTIIVLLILAGISIGAITGNNGIINQAQNAKDDTQYAQWEEQIDVAIIDAESKNRDTTMDNVIEELKNKGVIDDASQVNKKTGAITTNEPSYIIEDKLNDYLEFGPGMIAGKNEEYTDDNGDTATIPKGFEILEEADTIDDGLVIQDEDGNQFVWIPVTSESQYVRNKSYKSTTYSKTAHTDTGYLPEGIQPEIDNSENNERAEREAVLNSKGFYIARYEAGVENDKIVSKKDTRIWFGRAQEDDYKTAAKTFINNNYVKSALCSGIQWDVIMATINGKTDGNNQVVDVTVTNEDRHLGGSVGTVETGKNPVDKIYNIYDLEGNACEYVAERSDYSTKWPEVVRGGSVGIESISMMER